jgi:transposase
MAYVGIDLHTTKFTVTFKEGDESEVTESYDLDNGGINKFIHNISKDDHIFVEASTPTFEFIDRIKDSVNSTHVVDPFQFRVIKDSGKKNDKDDSKRLAKMGKYHREAGEDFLPAVYVPKEDIRKLRSLFTTYNLIKKEINQNKNRIYSFLKQLLLPYSKNTFFKETRYELDKLDIDEAYKAQIKSLLTILDELELQKEEIKHKILLSGEDYLEDTDILTSITGVSVFIALGLISDYVTINRFPNAKKFCKYLRSTPKTEQSNETTKTGKTQRTGRKLSMVLMVEPISHLKNSADYLSDFYSRIKKAKSPGKARVAMVRKMFKIMYFMLRDRTYYHYMRKSLHEKKMGEYRNLLKKKKVA